MAKPENPFGVRQPKNPFAKPKAEKLTAPRRFDFEEVICKAIKGRKLLKLTYDDFTQRTYQPSALYRSTKDREKILVGGVQITNPAKPQDNLEPHVFEVGRIGTLSVSDQSFVVDPQFDRFDKRYAEGILCSV